MQVQDDVRTVAAHDGRNTCLHGAHERVQVYLMLSAVVDVRGLVVALVLLLTARPLSVTDGDVAGEHVLVDVVLRARLNAALLQAKDSLVRGLARQVRVCTEPLPVPPTLRNPSHVHHRAERDMHALALELCTHRLATLTEKRPVPRRGDSDARRERGHEVGIANAKW